MLDERNNPAAEDEILDGESTGANEMTSLSGGNDLDALETIARYSHCPCCGANLHFSHVTDFIRNLTQESAKCPECGEKSRRVIHRLQ